MTTLTIPKKLTKEGELVIIPRKEYEKFLRVIKIIPKDQLWFWSKEWQKKEREADEALRKKEYKEFKNVKELLEDLHS